MFFRILRQQGMLLPESKLLRQQDMPLPESKLLRQQDMPLPVLSIIRQPITPLLEFFSVGISVRSLSLMWSPEYFFVS